MARAALVFLAASLAACCVVGGANVAADKQWAGSGAMFDAIAPRYDLINTFLSLGMHSWWRRAMVASLNLQSGDTVLDLGTGTADVAIEVAKYLRKQAGGDLVLADTVVGVDPSNNMLAHGRQKVAAAGFSARSVRLVKGDAQDLSRTLATDTLFDAATMAFAIRNVPDRLKALKSIRSHLKPGARFAILELGEPTFAPARWFVKHCVPWIGALLSGGARAEYEHLEKSVLNFQPAEFLELIGKAGLHLVSVRFMNFGSVGLYVVAAPMETPPPAAADAASEHGKDDAQSVSARGEAVTETAGAADEELKAADGMGSQSSGPASAPAARPTGGSEL